MMRLLTVIIFLEVLSGVRGFLDFTCLSTRARIDVNGVENVTIGGYKSGSGTYTEVTFGRSSDTGTSTKLGISKSNGLPPGSIKINNETLSAKLLHMPRSDGVQRIGAFYCNASNFKGYTESITTIVMSAASVVRPRQISQTVSVGESVTFVVNTNYSVSDLRWKHNDGETIPHLNKQTIYTIQNVTVEDAGVYECFHKKVIVDNRGRGLHAIFLLVVRACRSGFWNPSAACNASCPACNNGGICDERSGRCVCAPGFSGENCKTALGRNKWGQDGERSCSGSNNHDYGCQGQLFCLPHPYGCSCAAGFQGLDCDQECDNGKYGANCKQECHCAPEAYCHNDTGKCDGGNCHLDWYGDNCQERCTDQPPVNNLTTSANGTSITVHWNHTVIYDNCSLVVDYTIEYSLINRDNCNLSHHFQLVVVAPPNNRHTLSGLYYYSTYIVNVSVRREMEKYTWSTKTTNQTTQQAAPSGPPTNVTAISITSNTITLQWSKPKCGEQRGRIVVYLYRLMDSKGKVVTSGNVSSAVITFKDLKPAHNYIFSVSAMTEIGAGPYYEGLIVTARKTADYIYLLTALIMVSMLLFVSLVILLTMAHKNRSLKNTIKISESKSSEADTNTKKPQAASGQVTMLPDGHVRYKVAQQAKHTYQDLRDCPSATTYQVHLDDSAGKQTENEIVYAYLG